MIDPNIALSVKPPQFADPVEQMGKGLNLLAARQQLQLAPIHAQAAAENLHALQTENQQRDLDLQDQQNMRTVWVAAGGDPDKMLPLALRAGIGPKPLMALKESLMKMATEKAGLDEKTLANHAAKNDALNGLMQPVLTETDPAKQQQLWNQQMAAGLNSGILSPQEVEQHPYPGSPDAVKQYAAGLVTDKWATSQAAMIRAKAAADQAKNSQERLTAELPGIEASNLTKGLQVAAQTIDSVNSQPEYDAWRQANPEAAKRLPPMFSPALKTFAQRMGLSADQQITTDQAKANFDLQNRKENREANQGAQRIGIEGARLNLQRQQAGFEMNGGVSDAARGVANGDFAPATVRAMLRRAPGLISQIKQVDPNFDEANLENRYNTLKEFTSTQSSHAGGQAIALNTLIHHAALYQEVADALKNDSFTPGNAVYNKVAGMFGSAPPTQANLVAQFLAGETGKVATGGVPAEGEVKKMLESLKNDSSPEQFRKVGDTLIQIAGGRAQPLMQRVKDAKLDKVVQVLNPDSQEILKRRGFDPETMKPAAGGGGKKPLSEIFK